ncbi:MAG: hypothetical protein GY851_16320 [bacterium]|nr:hypothetical protein [bacterium]
MRPVAIAVLMAFHVAAWGAETDIRITDLSVCQPAEALSDVMEQGHWQRIPYEADGFGGVMVGAWSFVHAPEITLPLNREGWHRVYIGYWNPMFDWDDEPMMRVRFSDEAGFRLMRGPGRADTFQATFLRETFYACADLTGRDLVFGKANGLKGQKAYYAYVRLVPMSAEDTEREQQDRADRSTRRLTSVIDGLSYFHWGEFQTKQDILSLVEAYRNSDIERVIWAVNYGERVNYPSRVPGAVNVDRYSRGGLARPGDGAAYIEGEKHMHDALLAMQEQGIVPQRVAAEHARSMGIRFCGMMRLGILGPIPHEPEGERLLSKHPEYRQVLANGVAIEKASYAFPEVRQLMLDVLRESVTELGLDGMNLCFVRGPHLMQYEQPILDACRAKFDKDARELEYNDPALCEIRGDFMTEFLRDARRVLDEVGEVQGRKLELSIWAWPTTQTVWMGGTPIQEGLDIKAWIAEGLLDDVIFQEGVDPECQELCKEHGCTFTLFTGYRQAKAMKPVTIATAYGAGVERFAWWDMDIRQITVTDWAWMRRVGHREEMFSWDGAPYEIRSTRLRTVGGADVMHALEQSVYSGG